MVTSLLKEFAGEKIILLDPAELPFRLKGIIRLVDKGGRPKGIVLDNTTWIRLLEAMEYSHPAFWKEIEVSRKSGRVSSSTIEKRLGIK